MPKSRHTTTHATILTLALAASSVAVQGATELRAEESRPAAAAAAPADASRNGRPPPAPAAQTPLPARPGTIEEERAYARREAESPEVQEFSGGFVIELLLVAALVLVIILLAREL